MNPNNYFEEIGVWPKEKRGILGMYILGYVLSLLLTLAAYLLVVNQGLSQNGAIIVLAVLALSQFVVQLTCFLHLSSRSESRERLIVLSFACLIVLILVSGSIWIMFTLNDRQMPSTAQMEQYMNDQSGF